MSASESKFPEMPGWHFTFTEISFGVYRADGVHDDGRSVSRTSADLPAPIREKAEDARTLPAPETRTAAVLSRQQRTTF
jgi:hypothetical protein